MLPSQGISQFKMSRPQSMAAGECASVFPHKDEAISKGCKCFNIREFQEKFSASNIAPGERYEELVIVMGEFILMCSLCIRDP